MYTPPRFADIKIDPPAFEQKMIEEGGKTDKTNILITNDFLVHIMRKHHQRS
jgi:hypothetical protein